MTDPEDPRGAAVGRSNVTVAPERPAAPAVAPADDRARRAAILEAVAFAADRFLRGGPWERDLQAVLGRLGEAAEVSRVVLFETGTGDEGKPLWTMRTRWCAPNIPGLTDEREGDGEPFVVAAFPRWEDEFSAGRTIHARVRDMPPDEQVVLFGEQIRSIALVPVYAGPERWGFMGFDDCLSERRWTSEDIDVLRTAASILGAAILREQRERWLGEAESKYRALVEQIPAVTYIDAPEGPNTTLYISPQTESMLGLTQEDWQDDELLSKHVHADDLERWRAENERCDASGEPFSLEYRIVTPVGRRVWVHDEAILVRDESGRPAFWHGVMFDITARKEAEEALRGAFERERTAAQRLRTLDEMKNTFLEAVSHELRTPLTSILGTALTLQNSDLGLSEDDRRDLVDRLAANAQKLRRLLSDLLDLDRLGRGIIEPNRQPTDLTALVRTVLDESEHLAGRRVMVEADDVVVSLDAPKVERIVENLIANAARHTPEGSPVWLRVTEQDGGALIVVEDDGPGIPPDQRAAAFEPFQQVPGSPANHSPGVGVGLTLVARFAELHGGRAWVEEREGGGASFHVLLPPPEAAAPAGARGGSA